MKQTALPYLLISSKTGDNCRTTPTAVSLQEYKFKTNHLNVCIIKLHCFNSSVNKAVKPGVCKDYMVTHTQTDTQTNYYNPPPMRSG